MTLLDKSTERSLSDRKDMNGISGAQVSPPADDDLLPPSYTDVTSGQSPAPLPPASNFISIHRINGSIKGTWVVDTDLKVPAALLSPCPSTGERHNLSLTSLNGGITADVVLVSVSGKPDRASILLDTKNGGVNVNIISCNNNNNQPFKAVLKTCNGSIHVRLPRSFTGPIKHRTSNGTYEFSKEIQERFRAISNECSFVGSWEDSGFVDYEGWDGYELEASTLNGSIKFSYYGEDPGSSSSKGGKFLWFKW